MSAVTQDSEQRRPTRRCSSPLSRRRYYQFGRVTLAIQSNDGAFCERFHRLYSECTARASGRADLELRIEDDPIGQRVRITMCPDAPDSSKFARRLFADSDIGVSTCTRSEITIEDGEIVVSRDGAWQQMIATFAIAQAFRLQPEVLVFHAAAVAIGDRGVVLMGNKGVGKTTLSLTLAARGHAFLGDEWTAVCSKTLELLPLRRAASIRPGEHCAGVQRFLSTNECESESLRDGTRRLRAPVSKIFPSAAARRVGFTDLFFLGGFAPTPRVERFQSRGETLPAMTPLISTLWDHTPGKRAFQVLRTLGRVNCYQLDPGGSPDETADAIERTVKESVWG